MDLYHKWDVKNGFAYVLQFFSLISDGLGGVRREGGQKSQKLGNVVCERPLVKRGCQRKLPFRYINTSKQSPNMYILTSTNTYIQFWNINATQK